MSDRQQVRSKLNLQGDRVTIAVQEAVSLVSGIFRRIGCSADIAQSVALHLANSDLCGMESHGLMRTLQYVEQFESGQMCPDAEPQIRTTPKGVTEVDGCHGIGIPAMKMAVVKGCALAQEQGMSALAIRNVGHTGRLGEFTETAALEGCLCIVIGGGGRQRWRQVAPYGGRSAMLPTNPYSIGMPGGDRGPVVIDFATSKIAGGWIYAARSAGALLPDNALMDAKGQVTRDPEDYFRGGAIMPAGGAKGYALAVVAEMIAEAMLGPVTTEGNWLMITLDAGRFREPSALQTTAEELLQELRECPPAPGFEKVEVPGEREREHRRRTEKSGILIPEKTWQQIVRVSERLSG